MGKQNIDKEEKLREEFLEDDLNDDLREYLLGTSDHIFEILGEEVLNTVDDCKNIKELKDLKHAVLEYKEETTKNCTNQ